MSMLGDRHVALLLPALGAVIIYSVFVSPLWHESDAYRYALGIAAVYGLYNFARGNSVIQLGAPEYFSIGFALYVVARILIAGVVSDDMGIGSAEGVYAFPLVYGLVGYIIFKTRGIHSEFLLAYFLLSLTAAFVLFEPNSLVSGIRSGHQLFNNPIHAAAAMGMINLSCLPMLARLLKQQHGAGQTTLAVALLLLLYLITLSNVFTLQSKGVWLALVVASGLQAALFMYRLPSVSLRYGVLFIGALLLAGVLFYEQIVLVIGQPLSEALATVGSLVSTGTLIATDGMTDSVGHRVQLWAAGFDIWWNGNALIGLGPLWVIPFEARYSEIGFDIFHNSYLEILVRHGLVGVSFFVAITSWALRQIYLAVEHDNLDPSLFIYAASALAYFAIANLTNSHMRLAFGEMYLTAFVGFGFACRYQRQSRRLSP